MHFSIIILLLSLAVLSAACAGEAKVSSAGSTDKVEITTLSFVSLPNGKVAINACTKGLGGVGITLRVRFNTSPRGDESGQWKDIKELGVPCFNEIDRPVWDTSTLPRGKYLVRVEAKTPDDPNWQHPAVKTAVFDLK